MTFCFVLVFGFLSYACVVSGFPSPTAPAACSALQAAVPSGDKCSVSRDCTRLSCSMNVLNLYPIKYNVTIHKCHDPVQIVVIIDSTEFHWSRTFEGNQTVKINSLPPGLEVLVGQPLAHVEVNRVTGGIMTSAALWLDKNGDRTIVPIVDKQKIPLDTSDCLSIGHDSLPPNIHNPTDGSSWAGFPLSLSPQQLMDFWKKYGSFFNPSGKGPSGNKGGQNAFPLPSQLPTSWFDSTPSDMTDIAQWMNNPIVKMCVARLMQQNDFNHWKLDADDVDSKLLRCYCQNLDDASASLAPVQCSSVWSHSGRSHSSNDKDTSSDTKWYIIGGCVGGAILVAVVVAIVLFTIHTKKRGMPTVGRTYKELNEEEDE